jgi:DNA-binding XRE family transcriptional regulator
MTDNRIKKLGHIVKQVRKEQALTQHQLALPQLALPQLVLAFALCAS